MSLELFIYLWLGSGLLTVVVAIAYDLAKYGARSIQFSVREFIPLFKIVAVGPIGIIALTWDWLRRKYRRA